MRRLELILSVEAVGGSTILDALADGRELAQRLGISAVEVHGNGVTSLVTPGTTDAALRGLAESHERRGVAALAGQKP